MGDDETGSEPERDVGGDLRLDWRLTRYLESVYGKSGVVKKHAPYLMLEEEKEAVRRAWVAVNRPMGWLE